MLSHWKKAVKFSTRPREIWHSFVLGVVTVVDSVVTPLVGGGVGGGVFTHLKLNTIKGLLNNEALICQYIIFDKPIQI